ncbi:hypothetical protein FHW79_005339 [Azospirillum sp. OGB3]|uniref:hypothetical protein n=1 Tax=Azospirillum sp. OGB3 TaxID=2587012 RepID=UPI001605F9E9|nr:hypothetical protein [Azospirillum sp. OGB3]MBB3267674.1 hypothetical protein [Azospirillum sp. OGB3]
MPFSPNSISDAGWKTVEEARAKLGLPDADALYKQLERSVHRLQALLDGAGGRRFTLTLPWPGESRWYIFMGFCDPMVPASEMVSVTLDDLLEPRTKLVEHLVALGEAILQATQVAPASQTSIPPAKAASAPQRASQRAQANIKPVSRPIAAVEPSVASMMNTSQFALAL